jgi:hypothetical protein
MPDGVRPDDWRSLFHTYEETVNAPPITFAIEDFLQEQGVTLIGGLAGRGKTLIMLAMAQTLLEDGKLFTNFRATRQADRVLYLIPESALSPFAARLKTFRLVEHVGKRLFYRTLSVKHNLSLLDPRLLKAAEGADVFLDTAIRFMHGNENDASEQRIFAETLFNLQRAGARTITGAHHSPKGSSKDPFMTLENVLRGSGDIGAMLCTCWGSGKLMRSTIEFMSRTSSRGISNLVNRSSSRLGPRSIKPAISKCLSPRLRGRTKRPCFRRKESWTTAGRR